MSLSPFRCASAFVAASFIAAPATVAAAAPAAALLLVPLMPACAQQTAAAGTKNPVQKLGNYVVELRLPADGLFAAKEAEIEFRVTDASQEAPASGAAGVARAKIAGTMIMPSDEALPVAKPKINAKGVPGDYGLVTTFPRGGEYRLSLQVAPPGEGVEPFTVSFAVSVQDKDTSGKSEPAPKPYTLEIRSIPQRPVAGQEARLTFAIKERETGKTVTAFEEAHTKLIHLYLVRSDLGAFIQEHPTLNPDGTFTHLMTFPHGGEWNVFADAAPQGAGSQVLAAKLNVEGIRAPRTMLVAQNPPLLVRQGGYTLTLKTPKLPVGESSPLTFELRDNQGQPVTDMDLYLGALSHLVMIERDGKAFVHSYPDESDPRNGRGGTLTFNARFPKSGTYKGWLQFQRQGNLQTIPFVVRTTGK